VDYIQISNNGTAYTYADVYVYGNGTGADVTAMISPEGGHGSDASYEMGAFYVIMNTEIVGDESGFIPINGTYRNIGIVRNTLDDVGTVITDTRINTISNIHITGASGTYTVGEYITGSTSSAKGVLYYDPSGVDKYIDIHMIEGTFVDGESIYGQTSGEVGILDNTLSTYTNVDILSGDIIYKENIVFITRREIQVETFIFTIEF